MNVLGNKYACVIKMSKAFRSLISLPPSTGVFSERGLREGYGKLLERTRNLRFTKKRKKKIKGFSLSVPSKRPTPHSLPLPKQKKKEKKHTQNKRFC